jgi:hypothetical protein
MRQTLAAAGYARDSSRENMKKKRLVAQVSSLFFVMLVIYGCRALSSLPIPISPPLQTVTSMPSTAKFNLKCNISAQDFGFEITGETGSIQSTFNNETTSYNYDTSGQMTGITVAVNRDMFFESSQHKYHIVGTITVNQITNEITYDITATGDAFDNSPQTCKKP